MGDVGDPSVVLGNVGACRRTTCRTRQAEGVGHLPPPRAARSRCDREYHVRSLKVMSRPQKIIVPPR